MKKLKIKPEILSLLTSGRFDEFTSKQLIDAYKLIPSCSTLSHRQAQQFIFRNLDRFLWVGFIVKVSEGENRHATYKLTEKFTSKNYELGPPHIKAIKPEQNDKIIAKKLDPMEGLQDQLNVHKLELLTTIAETEEYEVLSEKIPEKQDEIQELYNDARNRCSKIMGKVKAIESLISHTGFQI